MDFLNEKRHCERAIEAALCASPVRLEEVTTSSPGTYLLLYTGNLPLYDRVRRPGGSDDVRSISEAGGAPVYVGSAQSLCERRGRHENNLRRCHDITTDDLLIITLPAPSEAGARHVELLLMATFRPVWNEPFVSGFGSKPQGTSRTKHQRPPKWSILHPGRHATAGVEYSERREALRQRVDQHLEHTVSDTFRIALPAR